MPSHRIMPLLLFTTFLYAGPAETAPWRQGTVVSVIRRQDTQRTDQPSPTYRCTGTSDNGSNSSTCQPVTGSPIKYWEVTIKLANQVLVIRPYLTASGVTGFLIGLLGKEYLLPPGVSAGVTVQVAIFSNGTVTLQNGSGQNYGGEIVTQTLIPEQKQEPVYAEPTSAARPTIMAEQQAEFPWKQVDDPNQRWKFTIRDQFVFGELAFMQDRQQLGDFFSIDAKKRGDSFVGTARLRATLPSEAGSTKTCEWTFGIELTSVTSDRIEGELSNEKGQAGCQTVGTGEKWSSTAIWIRE